MQHRQEAKPNPQGEACHLRAKPVLTARERFQVEDNYTAAKLALRVKGRRRAQRTMVNTIATLITPHKGMRQKWLAKVPRSGRARNRARMHPVSPHHSHLPQE